MNGPAIALMSTSYRAQGGQAMSIDLFVMRFNQKKEDEYEVLLS